MRFEFIVKKKPDFMPGFFLARRLFRQDQFFCHDSDGSL